MTQQDMSNAIPTVSIGMPVYNGEKYIREALDSVLSQTYQDFELIISDNASDDNTQAICVDYCQRDRRVKYVRQKENRGGRWNFHYVAQNARGLLFTWLAHDDILEPDFVEKCVEYMSMHSTTVLVSGDFNVIDENGKSLAIEKLKKIRDHIKWNKRSIEFFKYPISNVFFCIYGMTKTEICKSVLKTVREPKMEAGSELPILARFAVTGEITSIPVVLRKYRRHAASVYTNELAAISERSMCCRILTRIENLYRLRFDQMTVLLSSSLTPSFKYRIASRVLVSYITSFLARIPRIRSRLIGVLRSRGLFL